MQAFSKLCESLSISKRHDTSTVLKEVRDWAGENAIQTGCVYLIHTNEVRTEVEKCQSRHLLNGKLLKSFKRKP
jgi:hypothetical protein